MIQIKNSNCEETQKLISTRCPSWRHQNSENENIHKEIYIITTGNLPSPSPHPMQPTQNSIGPSIRIGREILFSRMRDFWTVFQNTCTKLYK